MKEIPTPKSHFPLSGHAAELGSGWGVLGLVPPARGKHQGHPMASVCVCHQRHPWCHHPCHHPRHRCRAGAAQHHAPRWLHQRAPRGAQKPTRFRWFLTAEVCELATNGVKGQEQFWSAPSAISHWLKPMLFTKLATKISRRIFSRCELLRLL